MPEKPSYAPCIPIFIPYILKHCDQSPLPKLTIVHKIFFLDILRYTKTGFLIPLCKAKRFSLTIVPNHATRQHTLLYYIAKQQSHITLPRATVPLFRQLFRTKTDSFHFYLLSSHSEQYVLTLWGRIHKHQRDKKERRYGRYYQRSSKVPTGRG